FQAEDGIRDDLVTGVQTCALPISGRRCRSTVKGAKTARPAASATRKSAGNHARIARTLARAACSSGRAHRRLALRDPILHRRARSEERRVGKETLHSEVRE